MKKLLISIIAFCLFFLSCIKKDECSDILCTTEFRVITVSVKDVNGNPVALDDFTVTDLNSGIDVTPVGSLETTRELGEYTLLVDGPSSIPFDDTKDLRFRGFINSEEVINSEYTFRGECCGVNLVSGDLNLTLN